MRKVPAGGLYLYIIFDVPHVTAYTISSSSQRDSIVLPPGLPKNGVGHVPAAESFGRAKIRKRPVYVRIFWKTELGIAVLPGRTPIVAIKQGC